MSRIYLPSYSKLVAVGDKIDFNDVGNLPAVIDVSRCREVTFRNCKFADGQVLQLGDGIKGNFDFSYNLPHDLDFTKFSEFQMLLFKFDNFDKVQFRKGAKIYLEHVSELKICRLSLMFPVVLKSI